MMGLENSDSKRVIGRYYLKVIDKFPESHFTTILLPAFEVKSIPQCPLCVIILCVCVCVCVCVCACVSVRV